MISHQDQARITAAIVEVEKQTRGEVFCVLAREVSRYREVPLLWAAAAGFIVPPLFVVAGLHRLALASIFTSWTDDSARAMEGLILRALTSYSLLQAGIFACVALVVGIPSVRRRLTPSILKRRRVRAAARRHFAATGARLSDSEPHVLIFASFADRKVEIVAHANIHQAVGTAPWDAAVAAVTQGMTSGHAGDGFVKAVEICGAALAQHFPSDGVTRDRLPNTLQQI
ncbi:MAG TPA: hypothetical protein VFQ69_00865 [Rhizomicrobium sp.]|jgi:putative membrane protein|nr:hypothetical protein [Rhizomicrobium sp.]